MSIELAPSVSTAFVPRAMTLNPDAPEFIPEAHRKVCNVVSRFINGNVEGINAFMASLVDGDEHTEEVTTTDGRMAFVDCEFFIEFYIPFTEEPPAGYVNLRKVMNRINRLLIKKHELFMSGVAIISSFYDTDKKMLIVKGIVEECE